MNNTGTKAEYPKPNFTVMPDFGGVYLWVNDEGTRSLQGTVVRRGLKKLENTVSDCLHLKFIEWQREFENNAYDSNFKGGFDWVAFHRVGIQLAVFLKEELGDKARVFYEKPHEDPNVHLNERREVMADGQLE